MKYMDYIVQVGLKSDASDFETFKVENLIDCLWIRVHGYEFPRSANEGMAYMRDELKIHLNYFEPEFHYLWEENGWMSNNSLKTDEEKGKVKEFHEKFWGDKNKYTSSCHFIFKDTNPDEEISKEFFLKKPIEFNK